MNILLIMPYFKTSRKLFPPLGVGYIASALEESGYNVDIKDLQIEYVPAKRAAKQIVDAHYDAIGISAITDNRFNAIDLIKWIKAMDKNIFIFAGGPHFGETAVDTLESVTEINAVVRGEGEETVCELMDACSFGKSFDSIEGLTYRDECGTIKENPDRTFILDLDRRKPAWHKFEMEKYNHSLDVSGMPFIGVISSRGCVYKCSFCSNSAPKIRFRTPENFVNEIEYLKKKYGYQRFAFQDSTFTTNRRHVIKICNLILERDLNIKWKVGVRVDTVDKEILELMKKAGCSILTYGLESGSEKVLKLARKNTSIDQIRKAIDISLEVGFNIQAFFMVGLPGETLYDLKKTIYLIQEFDEKGCNCTYGFTVIYPGTELERIAMERRVLPERFSWNTYRIFPKYFLTDTSKTVPYFEDEFKIQSIKLAIIRLKYDFSWRSIVTLLNKMGNYFQKLFGRTFIERT